MNTTRHHLSRRTAILGSALGLAVAVVPLGAPAIPGPFGARSTAVSPTLAASALSDSDVVRAREEERLAGDVYTALAAATRHSTFTRIAASEDRHQAAVEGLLTARGVSVSTLGNTPGDYAVDEFDTRYDEYVADGRASLTAAFGVGVSIEKADIADLEDILDQRLTDPEQQVFTALLNGSTHHLATFTRLVQGDAVVGGGAMAGPQGPGGRRAPRSAGRAITQPCPSAGSAAGSRHGPLPPSEPPARHRGPSRSPGSR